MNYRKCEDCGAEFVRTGEYVGCPNGHGKLWPERMARLPVDDRLQLRKEARATRMAAFPVATKLAGFRGVYRIDGHPGIWSVTWERDGTTQAAINGKWPRWFCRATWIEDAIRLCKLEPTK